MDDEIEVENIAPQAEVVVPLNFRVPPEFRRRFKVAAAQRGILMTDLLKEIFEEWIRSQRKK
ncbi:hypothetical protein [Castellaniella sp.]|uniref:ribbon-helix-helix protein n=1 Tax=Castellaniella sp. TaxID=1955812 RepID=UPI002AFEB739|nr:hypothetical protein [Castellaniella sp.]